jgi:hypothetical protein
MEARALAVPFYGNEVSQVVKVSNPGPPMQISLLLLPTKSSSPPPPRMQSLPPRPLILSSPGVPISNSLALLPLQFPPVHTTIVVNVMDAHSAGFNVFAVIALA